MPLPQLTFNSDEFFNFITPGANRKWTWHPRSEAHRVVLRECRNGVTITPLVSAGGIILGAQIIWHGKTDAVHFKPEDGLFEDPMILQDHNLSHWQNSHTQKRLIEHFLIPYVRILRTQMGLTMETSPGCYIVDAFGGHFSDDIRMLLSNWNIRVIQVPKKQTHVWQPCDQYIIANIKQTMQP